MIDTSVILGLLLGLFVTIKFILWYYGNMLKFKMPAGPWGLPVVGYLPFLGAQPHETFMRLKEKYGDVFAVQIGSFQCIVVNGRSAIKDMLLNSVGVFDSRPQFYSYALRNGRFVLGNYNEKWLVMKKTVIEKLTMFMNDKESTVEGLLEEEALMLVKNFEKHNGKPFDPQKELNDTFGSILYQILYGKRSDIRNDKDFKQLLAIEKSFADHANLSNPAEVIPRLSKICYSAVKPIHDLTDYYMRGRKKKELEQRRNFIKSTIRNLTDTFLEIEGHETSEMKSVGLTVDDLVLSLEEMFSAGFDVTATTMRWIVLILVRFPLVQRQLYDKIEREIGNRTPTVNDMPKLPYTEAVILETMRYKSPMPLTTHSTTRHARIETYVVPKDTPVIFNLHSLTRDPKLWEYPDGFYPEHFLSADGQVDREKAGLIFPFGMGKRKCIGETITRNSLFLCMVKLVQKFEIIPVDGEEYNMVGVMRTSDSPKPYKIIAQER